MPDTATDLRTTTARVDVSHDIAPAGTRAVVAASRKLQPRRVAKLAHTIPALPPELPSSAPALDSQPLESLVNTEVRSAPSELSPAQRVFTPDAPLDPEIPLPVRHAEQLADILMERLREVERREVQATEFSERLEHAEQAAKQWVIQQETEFRNRDQALRFKEDELTTKLAALAAEELNRDARWRERETNWQQEIQAAEERVRASHELATTTAQQAQALTAARKEWEADRRRAEEQLDRLRQQVQSARQRQEWQQQRLLEQLRIHREALEQQERRLVFREMALEQSDRDHARSERLALDAARVKATAAHDRRLATEQRWIAGRLWKLLLKTLPLPQRELEQSLVEVQRELETAFQHELEEITQLRAAILEYGKKLQHAYGGEMTETEFAAESTAPDDSLAQEPTKLLARTMHSSGSSRPKKRTS